MMLKVIIMAAIVEALVETLKMIWDKDKISKSRVLAIILGIFISITYQIDLIGAVGIEAILPIFGYILTGILISRGANFVSDFLKGIKKLGDE